jgi:hypothetical protein
MPAFLVGEPRNQIPKYLAMVKKLRRQELIVFGKLFRVGMDKRRSENYIE